MKHNQETKRMVRLYGAWAWEKEEAWLDRMAQKGWLMTGIQFFTYTFHRAQPGTNWIYQLDYNGLSGEELEEYKQIFRDAGWDYVDNFASWHYFRADGDAVKAKTIHTNNESRIKMLWRVTGLIALAGFPSYIWMMTTGRYLQTFTESGTFTFMDATLIFVMLLIGVMLYAIIRLFLKIMQLKREVNE